MQFVQNGPDVPNGLLHAHEEGKAVFFCGAGISMKAGLPDFRSLTCRVFQEVGLQMNDAEQEAFKSGRYDAVFSLLEARHIEERHRVRRAVREILTPGRLTKPMKATHEALLKLARDRGGATRIVTTNFDRVFEKVGGRTSKCPTIYEAPYLPIPKKSRWDGIVHLHGRLPQDDDLMKLNRLVLSSGDFGLAYLAERWASRFVTELFRTWTVCFVGYGINDPVMRYLTDAVAADRSMGESSRPAYAFVGAAPGDEEQVRSKWVETTGVRPVIYSDQSAHRALHETLRVWSEAWCDGIEGKERIIDQCVFLNPSQSTAEDDFVGRVMWALEDPSGVPARRFAELDPPPSISWLDELSRLRFSDDDLPRFGIEVSTDRDHRGPEETMQSRFSLLSRPSSHIHGPRMSVIRHPLAGGAWDEVMKSLARWLVRHLDDEHLLLWVVENGDRLDDQFIWIIRSHIYGPKKSGGQFEKECDAHYASGDSLLRRAWRLALENRLGRVDFRGDLYDWKRRLEETQSIANKGSVPGTLETALRFELRRLLSPRLKIKRAYNLLAVEESGESTEAARPKLRFEVVLGAQYPQNILSDQVVQKLLPQVIDDLELLLKDALDLLQEVELANHEDDYSHWDLHSIEPDSEIHRTMEWVTLIESVRDAWLEIVHSDRLAAVERARSWWRRPFPTFKRLALFAASRCVEIDAKEWAGWLMEDNGFWIWSDCTKAEICGLFLARGKDLRLKECRALEKIILAGPPENGGG